MNIDYWRLFLLALALLAVMIVFRWFSDAWNAFASVLPSSNNSPRYNLAAGVMCLIGGWGVIRLLRGGSHQG